MSSESSNTNTRNVQTGFSASDISSFLQKGNTQGSMKTKKIERFKPTRKNKFRHDTETKESQLWGKPKVTRSTHFTGFMGEFADDKFTDEKVNTLVSSFMQREKQVREGRNLVGRKQLFQERT